MSDIQKSLQDFLKATEKEFGKGTVFVQGNDDIVEIDSISTGSLNLDKALGVGGLPQGRIVEIYGPESSGKSTLCLETVRQSQIKDGKPVLYIDTEHALDLKYAQQIGVDLELLVVSQPDSGEDALSIMEKATASGVFSLVIVDSVAALTPRAEINGDIGDQHVGLQARLMSHALRKVVGIIKKTNTTVIFTNQIRMKIGVMYGSPETTTGGNALKFYASVRLDIRRIKTNSEGGEAISNRVRVKTIKNKVAPPFKEVEFDIVFGEGIDYLSELIDIGVENDIINKAGAWFSYGDTKIGQGKSKVKTFLLSNDEIMHEIECKVKDIINKKGVKEFTPTEEDLEA